MILEHFLLAENETNCYIVACTETGETAVIDPGEWNDQLADLIKEQKLSLKWALITHGHGDHIGGVEVLKQSYLTVHVAAHSSCPGADVHLSDGDTVQVGKLNLRVLETPGHTDDSLSFVLGSDVFCGDAIFAGSVGGTNNRQDYERLIQAIRHKLFTLGDDIVLHPGHGPATTVQIERLFNPFLIS
jgi:glyoxylase-like metal-dependent hydrolase (beta-lactamase superfamily II)